MEGNNIPRFQRLGHGYLWGHYSITYNFSGKQFVNIYQKFLLDSGILLLLIGIYIYIWVYIHKYTKHMLQHYL